MQASGVEIALADLGSSQWGLVTAPQAHRAGVSRDQLFRLGNAGILVRLTHGVYALRGSMSTEHIELRAAWLALDPTRLAADRLDDGPRGPVVSHASAATLHGLGDLDADRHEFTTSARKQTRRSGLRLHRATLPGEDVTLRGGLPVTTLTRTIVDLLADGHDGGHVAGVLADAVRTRQLNLTELAPRLSPFAGRFGLSRRDGHALLQHLLELGGVAEQAATDQLAVAARAAHLPVSDLIATIAGPAAMAVALQEARFAPFREMKILQEAQLAPLQEIAARLTQQQLAPLLEIAARIAQQQEAYLAPIREIAAAGIARLTQQQLAPLQEIAARLTQQQFAPLQEITAAGIARLTQQQLAPLQEIAARITE